jgi:hypothetical protein
MARSRSSFDLAGAIATAESLSTTPPEEVTATAYRGMALVSFGPTATGPATPPPPPPEAPLSPLTPPPLAPPPVPEVVAPESAAGYVPEGPATEDAPAVGARRPPHLPDLSGVASPTARCEQIVAWIVEAVGAQDVFIADASGLPVAGIAMDAEARVAASGVVASAVAHLAASVPGNSSALFEVHLGEGPFFQLIGFEIASAIYLVGLTRATPLTYRQAHAVRLACRHALDFGPPRAGGAP